MSTLLHAAPVVTGGTAKVSRYIFKGVISTANAQLTVVSIIKMTKKTLKKYE